jgi:hypothetical protein
VTRRSPVHCAVNEGAPVSVTLIKPAGIDTPFPQHARSYQAHEPKLPPPVYPPSDVARAIRHAAEHPVREIFVGGAAKMLSTQDKLTPGMLERMWARLGFDMQLRDEPARDPAGSVDQARGGVRDDAIVPSRAVSFSRSARVRAFGPAPSKPGLTAPIRGRTLARATAAVGRLARPVP